ncbi:DUF418 domain-containing protein [Oceanobacillus halotolerans]|uniref:DUF418 domain-containing protein n=1 Tax=Oceanobacillus halotolerans TaxID=2663380 RepID=UPI0013DBF8E6|nr:DUF418 domain-containing protein [Oceanobacillus halotolerans]
MSLSTHPTKEKQRYEWIDASRGFAVFGIFIVNIGAFSAPYFLYGGEYDAWTSPIDQVTLNVIDIFFQASFYTLFSILFGVGFQILIDRLKVKQLNSYAFLSLRLVVLIAFGLLHAFLIWHGDILLTYGIIGLMLLAFIHVKDRTLIAWALALLLGSVGLLTLAMFTVRDYLQVSNEVAIQTAIFNYRSNDLSVILSQNYTDWVYGNGGLTYLLLVGTILPFFLIGMYIARKRWLHDPAQHRSILVKVWIGSLILFVLLKMGPYLYGNPLWFSYMQDNIGGSASALFYISSITLLAQTGMGKTLLTPLTYVGRLALTNYITQSLLSFFLFYGIGLGLYGSIRPVVGVGIVGVIFLTQIMISKWWLQHFQFGPLEWVWRSATYLRLQPLRKKRLR